MRIVQSAAIGRRNPTSAASNLHADCVRAVTALLERLHHSNVLDPEISDDVRALIQRHMATMDHVEVLAVLRAQRDTSFSVAELTSIVRKPEKIVDVSLRALVAAALVAQLSDGTYRYSGQEDADRAAEAVVKMYNERPVTLVRLLYERPTAVNTFADAFKLRKDA